MRQHSKLANCAAIMEKPCLVNTVGDDFLAKDEFTTSDPTVLHEPTNEAEVLTKRKYYRTSLDLRKMRNQLSTFFTQSSSLERIHEHLHVGSAAPQLRW